MGYGTGYFGLAPLGVAIQQASTADPARVSTSRKIDPLTKRFVQVTNGGFAGMTDTCQRVLLLTLQAMAGRATIITPDEQVDTEQRVRAALAPLLAGREPAIELLAVTVEDDGRDAEQVAVTFRDLATGKVETARPRKAA